MLHSHQCCLEKSTAGGEKKIAFLVIHYDFPKKNKELVLRKPTKIPLRGISELQLQVATFLQVATLSCKFSV